MLSKSRFTFSRDGRVVLSGRVIGYVWWLGKRGWACNRSGRTDDKVFKRRTRREAAELLELMADKPGAAP